VRHNQGMRGWLVASLIAASLLAAPMSAAAVPAEPQQQSGTQQPPPKTPPSGSGQSAGSSLPVDVDKIKTIVNNSPTPPLNYEGMKARFYVRVDANQLRFSDFIGHFDLLNGPVPRAGQTYGEFMQMVTPKELYSAAGIKPTEELQMALTGFLAQALARRAIDEIKNARTAGEIQAIRDRITKELAALTGGK